MVQSLQSFLSSKIPDINHGYGCNRDDALAEIGNSAFARPNDVEQGVGDVAEILLCQPHCGE